MNLGSASSREKRSRISREAAPPPTDDNVCGPGFRVMRKHGLAHRGDDHAGGTVRVLFVGGRIQAHRQNPQRARDAAVVDQDHRGAARINLQQQV